MYTGLSYIVLNKDTLVGREQWIGHDKNFRDGSLDTEYQSTPITLRPVACTVIWK
jgi:hypothetical protein